MVPIVIFAHSRPEKLRRVIAAVKAQTVKPEAVIAVVDGPRSDGEAKLTRACVRDASAAGFTVISRDANLGCAASIMNGVNDVATGFSPSACPAFMVLEDDVVPASCWYESMLLLLVRYRDDPVVGSVGSFPSVLNGALDGYGHDVILSPRFSCWGWGCWTGAKWDAIYGDWASWSAGRGLGYDPAHLPGHGGGDIGGMICQSRPGTLWDGVVAGSHLHRGWLQAIPKWYLSNNIGADAHLGASRLHFMMTNNPLREQVPASFPPQSVLDASVSAAVCDYVRAMGS